MRNRKRIKNEVGYLRSDGAGKIRKERRIRPYRRREGRSLPLETGLDFVGKPVFRKMRKSRLQDTKTVNNVILEDS